MGNGAAFGTGGEAIAEQFDYFPRYHEHVVAGDPAGNPYISTTVKVVDEGTSNQQMSLILRPGPLRSSDLAAIDFGQFNTECRIDPDAVDADIPV